MSRDVSCPLRSRLQKIGAVLAFGAGIWLLYEIRVARPARKRVDAFEAHLQQSINPEEIRQWAYRFMTEHPDASGERLSNAPAALMHVASVPPAAVVLGDKVRGDQHVVLFWSTTLPAVVIGESNFVSVGDRKWRNGIYIQRPHRQ